MQEIYTEDRAVSKNQDSREEIRAIVDKRLNVSCQWGDAAKGLMGRAEERHWNFSCKI